MDVLLRAAMPFLTDGMKEYDHKQIEAKWQKLWQESGVFNTPDHVKGKENYYFLTEFPYPSGNLHVGHWYAFSVPDIFVRYMRMRGYNVLGSRTLLWWAPEKK